MAQLIYLKKWMTEIFLLSHLLILFEKTIPEKDVEYCFKLIWCSTNSSNAGRQKVMAKHKSHCQKELHAKRKKIAMHNWNLPWKNKFCLIKQYGTSHRILQKKKSSHRGKWYKSLDPVEKKSFCPNQQIGVNHLVMQKNKIFCLAEQFGINH